MSTHKYMDNIGVFVTAMVLLLTVLLMNGNALGIEAFKNIGQSSEWFTADDLNADWDTSGATEIILSDEGTIVKGNGAYVSNGDIYIVYAGKYLLSGELMDGAVIVNADGDDDIWLMLDGVSIDCEDDAALRIEQAGKVFVTLADGTENTLSSGAKYKADVQSAGVDGTIYSRDDLTINGKGALSVTAKYRHGIVCNDSLVLAGGTIMVEAVQDGFHVNDSVCLKDADIHLAVGDDGITVSNDDETAFFYMESGNINISSCYEGLEAIDITIAGGTVNITSTDDGINANGSGTCSVIRITGGDITIMNPSGRDADGLDSNKDIYISGGRLFVSVVGEGINSALDYGTEHGGVCEVSGGTVIACGSSAMAEGFDTSSPQGFLMYDTSADAGTVVSLKSADGSILLSEEIPYSFSSVVISTPEMAIGDTCTMIVGETAEEITIDNVSRNPGAGGVMSGSGMLGKPGESQMAGGDMQGKPGEGQMPGMGENVDHMPPDLPASSGNVKGAPPEGQQPKDTSGSGAGGMLPEPRDGMAQDGQRADRFEKEHAASDEGLSAENQILFGISVAILVLGCAAAIVFKRR